jgi:4-alpha-glucanotransferase
LSERPALGALAARLGIEDGYHSSLHRHWITTSDATREALLAAMGLDASSEAACQRTLDEQGEPAKAATSDPPARCVDVDEKLGPRGVVFGLVANLYSVRSARNFGFGNLGDLAQLVRRAGAAGAAFVGVNPLHAGTNRSGAFCPYDPVSRLYREPLYLDPLSVPESAHSPELGAEPRPERVAALQRAARLEPAALENLLLPLLRGLHRRFLSAVDDAGTARRRAFETYRSAQGAALENFAAFQVLADHFEQRGGRDWRRWPDGFHNPGAPAVREFRAAHTVEIGFRAWLQFELERQLGLCADAARESGMAIGVYADLALGSSGGGSDTWSWPGLFARGASAGAPPDDFSIEGQNWGFPPIVPQALRADGCAFWKRLLAANFRHVGALRIDHAMSLRRLFWIPEGRGAAEGAYVRYPETELLDALAAASRQADALAIAEDLGTVPEGFTAAIQARGMLGSRVLLFERDGWHFKPSHAYPRAVLATASTHDLPPLAALASEEDLELRRRVGQIPDDARLEGFRHERREQWRALTERLQHDAGLDPRSAAETLGPAVARFLCATPAALVGLQLDDLGGEREPINLPGVPATRHPSWTRRMHEPLETLFDSPAAAQTLAAVPDWRRNRSV